MALPDKDSLGDPAMMGSSFQKHNKKQRVRRSSRAPDASVGVGGGGRRGAPVLLTAAGPPALGPRPSASLA